MLKANYSNKVEFKSEKPVHITMAALDVLVPSMIFYFAFKKGLLILFENLTLLL